MNLTLSLFGASLHISFAPSALLDRSYVEHYIPLKALDNASDEAITHVAFSLEPGTVELPQDLCQTIQLFPGQVYAAVKRAHSSICELTSLDLSHKIAVELDCDSSRYLPTHIRITARASETPRFATSVALRAVRDICQRLAYGRNAFMMHSSCVTRGGKALLFAGAKGSGKTTSLLRALSDGWDFLANDRVLINPDTREVFAFPIAAMLDQFTVSSLPVALREKVMSGITVRGISERARAGREKIGLTPREVAESYGRSFELTSKVDTIYVLGSCGGGHRVHQTVADCVYCPVDPTYVFDWCTRTATRATQAEEAARLFQLKLIEFGPAGLERPLVFA